MAVIAKGKYEYWLTDDGLTLLRGWKRAGLTDEQIAKQAGISRKTLYEWQSKFSDIRDALKKGAEIVYHAVEDEMLKSAHVQIITIREPMKVKTVQQDGGKKLIKEHIEYVEKQVVIPANVTAQIYWLNNRGGKTKLATVDDGGFMDALKDTAEEVWEE